MTAWKNCILGDVVELQQGLAINKKTNHLIVDEGIPLLRITDLINNKQTQYIDENKVPKKFITKPSDLIYTRTGQVGLVFKGRVGIIHNNCFRVIPNAEVDTDYLYWFLKQETIINYANSVAAGAAQPDLNHNAFKSIPFSYPELDTQKKIAGVLSTYDDLIENNTRRIRILEQMAQSIYEEWFGKVNGNSLSEGWEKKTLGDIAKEVRRSVQPNEIDPETPYFGLEHLPRKSIALSEWGKASDVKSTKLAFKEGEILFGKIRPYFHKVGVAPLDGVSSTDAIVITPKEPYYFGLTLSYVSSEDFVNHATQTSQGTKMPRANWDVLVKYPILIPPDDVLRKHNDFMKDIVNMIQNLLFANRNLRRTRDLLLPRLVSGELLVERLEE